MTIPKNFQIFRFSLGMNSDKHLKLSHSSIFAPGAIGAERLHRGPRNVMPARQQREQAMRPAAHITIKATLGKRSVIVPSGNQRCQWTMNHLSLISDFRRKKPSSISGIFQLVMFDFQRVYDMLNV